MKLAPPQAHETLTTFAWAAGFLLWLAGIVAGRGSFAVGWELLAFVGGITLLCASIYRRWADSDRRPLSSHTINAIVAYGGGGLAIVTMIVGTAAIPIFLAAPLTFLGLVMVIYTFPPIVVILAR